ncbi:MAG TPA: endonuclease/exonuclease/phosphatase family protein [Jatrophihabitans sp.]|nr:endonuclease/exonuclease/phosphatase family protein [Jatrophihabitans sp.]
MRLRSVSGTWQILAAACCVACSVVLIAGCTTSGRASSLASSVVRPTGSSDTGGAHVGVLQMNLCDSGIAECYTGGRSVIMAAALIHALRPDVVTLNEVCREDVSVLERAMSATHRRATVASAFKPAADRRTDGPYRCVNGQQFGDGVLALVPSGTPGYRTYGGIYPIQDVTDSEERVWMCIDLATQFAACTTHTASTSTAIALAQCRYFLNSVVPRIRRQNGDAPVILGADLNLPANHSPGPQACLPHGYQRADDGARQDAVTSPAVVVRSRTLIDMRGTTDHPGLLVDTVLPRRSRDRR